MIVRCFSCSTRFLLNPQDLGEEGRQVRCGKCGYSWHQLPGDGSEQQDVSKSDIQPVSHQLPKVAAKPSPKTLWYAAATAWLLLLVGAAFFVGFRQQVVSVWEPADRVYRLVGMGVPVPGEGLVLSNIISRTYEADDRKPMVLVTGQVVNTTSDRQPLPKLNLELRDDARQPLLSWQLELPVKELAAGETVDFLTQQPVDNVLANNVLVQFTAR